MVRRLVRFIRDAGLTHFAYRCDRQAAINAMIDEACSVLGRTGKKVITDDDHKSLGFQLPPVEEDEPDASTEVPIAPGEDGPVVAVPEVAHPGESASNGLAERAVGVVEDHIKTLLPSLKIDLGVAIPIDHALADWLVEHSAYVLNKYSVNPN